MIRVDIFHSQYPNEYTVWLNSNVHDMDWQLVYTYPTRSRNIRRLIGIEFKHQVDALAFKIRFGL